VEATSSKASMTLGFLSRNFRDCNKSVREQAYTTMVRSTLEYASAAWDPYTCDQINQRAEQHVLSATITETKPQDADAYSKVDRTMVV
jgi:hypothetical protein